VDSRVIGGTGSDVTATAGAGAPAHPADLDSRYGRTPGTRRRRLWFAVVAAVAFVVVFTAWVIWAGLDGSGPSLEANDTGYDLIGDDHVAVRFALTVEPGTPVRCAVQALDDHFEVVGWKVIDVPPSDERSRSLVETIRTVSPANTGLISKCWLP
jgi:hypothetical protein